MWGVKRITLKRFRRIEDHNLRFLGQFGKTQLRPEPYYTYYYDLFEEKSTDRDDTCIKDILAFLL